MMLRSLLKMAILALVPLLSTTRAIADYALQPGDRVEVTVAGLPDYAVTAMVDGDGSLGLGWIGRLAAQGRTVEDLEIDVRALADGEILRRYNRDGQVYTITLEGARIDLQRIGYRPVIVGGDVSVTGEVAFTPGMTVREAVAHAGGIETLRDMMPAIIDPVKVIEWRSEFQEATVAQLDARLSLWRTTAALDEAWERPPPDLDPGPIVPVETVLGLTGEQRELLVASQREFEREAAYYEAADTQANRRIAILTEQRSEQRAATEFDREEVERTRELVERSLAPSSRLAEIRRTTAASSTQLLDIEEALSAAELARLRLKREYEQSVEQRTLELLAERRLADAAFRAATIRMEVLSQFLGVSGSDALALSLPQTDYSATLVRKTAEGPVIRPVAKDATLEPGDFVEIELLPVPQDPSGI